MPFLWGLLATLLERPFYALPSSFRQKEVWLTHPLSGWVRTLSPQARLSSLYGNLTDKTKFAFRIMTQTNCKILSHTKRLNFVHWVLLPVTKITAEFIPLTRTFKDYQQMGEREHSPCSRQTRFYGNMLPIHWTPRLGFLITYASFPLFTFCENLYNFHLQ